MSGEKDRVKDADSARKEAHDDAEQIKNAGTTEESYKKFKQELDDMSSSGVDKSLITEFRKSLTKELGADFNKKMAVEYLADAEGGQKLKDSDGNITKQSITDRVQMGALNDDLSEEEKMMLPQVYLNFAPISEANTGDDYRGITSSDIEASRASNKADEAKKDAVDKNKKQGFAEALVDPSMQRLFNNLDIADQVFSTPDGYVSHSDVDRFLRENPNYPDSEKKAMEALKFINAHWDDEQVKQLRGGSSYLTRDSIAIGCGYKNAADFEQQLKAKSNQTNAPSAERDEKAAKETVVDYQGAKRTFHINKDGQLLGYTEVKADATHEYTVDKEGNVKEGDKVVATNANFNESTKEFKYKWNGQDVTEPAVAAPAAERDEKAAKETMVDYQGAKRTFHINKDGQLLGYTEVKGDATHEYTVDKEGNVKEGDKVVATNANFNESTNEFKYKYNGQDIAEQGKAAPAAERDTKVAKETVAEFQGFKRTFHLNKDGQMLGFTESKGDATHEYTVDKEGNVKDGDKTVATNASFNESTNEFKYKINGKDVTEVATKPSETVPATVPTDGKDKPSSVTLKYGDVERTFTLNGKKQLTGYTEKKGNATSTFSVDPATGLAKNNESNEPAGNVSFDAATGKFTNNFKGENNKVTQMPDLPPQRQGDLKNKALLEAATQHSGQGYWQVADEMLKKTKGADDKPEDSTAENIILMRALQLQHKQQGGQLGNHKFLSSQSDLAKLNENIDAYIQQHPSFAKYKEALHKRLAMVEAS